VIHRSLRAPGNQLRLSLDAFRDGRHVERMRQTDDVETSVQLLRSDGRRLVNTRSIFKSVNRSSDRRLSEEKPYRSHQIAMRMPAARNSLSAWTHDEESPESTPSVISRSSPKPGFASQIADGLENFARNIGVSQLRGRHIDGHSDRRQALAAPGATVGRRLPEHPGAVAPIKPPDSSSGRKMAGAISPFSGSCQRSRASTLAISAGVQSDLGLVVQQELPFLERRAQPVFHGRRAGRALNSSRCGDADSVRPRSSLP